MTRAWPASRSSSAGTARAASWPRPATRCAAIGVHSAMPMHQALRAVPAGGVRAAAHGALPGSLRPGVRRCSTRSPPLVQGLSLDEAFLDVTASQQLLGDPVQIARAHQGPHQATHRSHRLRGRRPQQARGQDRLRPRQARRPDGGQRRRRVREVLDPLSVRRMPGLGKKTGAKVQAAGIATLGQLRSAPDAVLWPLFGRYSPWMRERAAGIDERPVQGGHRGRVPERGRDLRARHLAMLQALQRGTRAAWPILPPRGCGPVRW